MKQTRERPAGSRELQAGRGTDGRGCCGLTPQYTPCDAPQTRGKGNTMRETSQKAGPGPQAAPDAATDGKWASPPAHPGQPGPYRPDVGPRPAAHGAGHQEGA